MNPTPDPFRANEPSDGDPRLDRLLAQARWPEPSPSAERRLRARWFGLRRWQIARRMVATVAVAAAVLITIGTIVVVVRRTADQTDSEGAVPTVAQTHVEEIETSPPAVRVSREPTLRELLVLAPRPTSPADERATTAPAERISFDQMLAQAAAAESGSAQMRDAIEHLHKLGPREHALRRLHRAAQSETDERRLGAVRLLAHIGGRESLPLLAAFLDEQPPLRDVGLDGVLRLASAEELAALARRDARFRRSALAALAKRGRGRSAELFVAFVLDERTREDALESLHGIDTSTAAAGLLRLLDHPRVEYRLAAARALGEMCPDGVAPQLRRMVQHNVHRREALAALMYCPDPDAAQFLTAAARRQPVIGSEIRVIRSELNQLFEEKRT